MLRLLNWLWRPSIIFSRPETSPILVMPEVPPPSFSKSPTLVSKLATLLVFDSISPNPEKSSLFKSAILWVFVNKSCLKFSKSVDFQSSKPLTISLKSPNCLLCVAWVDSRASISETLAKLFLNFVSADHKEGH